MGAFPLGKVSAQQSQFARALIQAAQILDEEQALAIEEAFAAVDRQAFVSDQFKQYAYQDCALPIGYDQMSSVPSRVARTIALAGVQKGSRVLEIGFGSGYTSAVMSALGAHVFGLETIGLLAQQTRKKLDSLYFQNVLVRRAEGARGWHEHAPYDSIILWHPTERVDPELLSQLTVPGGRLIAMVGAPGAAVLTLWRQQGDQIGVYQLEAFQPEAP